MQGQLIDCIERIGRVAGIEIACGGWISTTAKDAFVSAQRIFISAEFFVPSSGDPLRTVVTQSTDAVVVAWHVAPGQTINPHVHPAGQDTWTILSGRGKYITSAGGESRDIGAGDVAVATTGQVHGVFNHGADALTFISVVSPVEAGYELVDMK